MSVELRRHFSCTHGCLLGDTNHVTAAWQVSVSVDTVCPGVHEISSTSRAVACGMRTDSNYLPANMETGS